MRKLHQVKSNMEKGKNEQKSEEGGRSGNAWMLDCLVDWMNVLRQAQD
jgi:hypothetical protein